MPASPTRETVIVVHGTFAGNASGDSPMWYAPGGSFCAALDTELAARGSNARCWAHLAQGEAHFYWDGANDWLSRVKAGTRLRAEIRRLHAGGWRVHLVAHSHGGNIVLNAITDQQKDVERWFVARVALLGTPIYRSAHRYARREGRARRWLMFSLAIWAIVLFASARRLDFAAAFQVGGPAEPWAISAAVLLICVTAALVVRTSPRVQLWFGFPFTNSGTVRWSPRFLLINSEYDEAYRALAGLPNAPNPLLHDPPSPMPHAAAGAAVEPTSDSRNASAPHRRFTSGVLAVVDAVRTRTATRITSTLDTPRTGPPLVVGFSVFVLLVLWRATSERLVSVPLPPGWAAVGFLAVLVIAIAAACVSPKALLFPAIGVLEILGMIGRAVSSLMLLALDRVIKRFVWDTLKSLSLGLSGAADGVDDVLVDRELPAKDCVYLELPTDIVAAVHDQQTMHGGEIHRLVYRPGLVWSPLSLLKELESTEFPLVHCSYYDNAECIQKMADWIGEPMVEQFDGHYKTETLQAVSPRNGPFQNIIRTELESSNHYEDHVSDLREKYGPVNTRWGTRTKLLGLRSIRPVVGTEPPSPRVRSPYDGPPP